MEASSKPVLKSGEFFDDRIESRIHSAASAHFEKAFLLLTLSTLRVRITS